MRRLYIPTFKLRQLLIILNINGLSFNINIKLYLNLCILRSLLQNIYEIKITSR